MKKTKNTFSVLIPDAETFAFPYILHCMSDVKNIRLFVMSTKKDFPLRYSRYVHRFFFFPKKNNQLEWIDNINKITDEHGIDVIMPIHEIGIKTLIEHKALLFQNINKLVPLPSLQNFTIAGSKDLLADHLNRLGIPGPNTAPLTIDLLEDRDRLKLSFPILVKPLKSGSGRGIVKFEDHESLAGYFKIKGLNEAYILQEFIKGAEYGCNVLCKDGEILAYTIQKGNLWDPAKPYSSQIGLEFLYEDKLYQTVKKLMKSLNWSGVADLDLLYDHQKDVFYILEINPRFWATLTAAHLAGVNYPYLLISMTMKEDFGPQHYKHIGYVVLKGLKPYFKKNKALIFKMGFIWQSTPLKYKIYDPIPIVYKFIQRNKLILFGKIQKLFLKKKV